MKCKKCGAEIDGDSCYCEVCGARQPKGLQPKVWMAIVAAVVMAFGVLLILLLPSRNTPKPEVPLVVDTMRVIDTIVVVKEKVEDSPQKRSKVAVNTTETEKTPVPKMENRSVAAGYADLGLTSGTLWKSVNVNGFYTYDEAVSQYGRRLPSKAQWEELKSECQWYWVGNGYKVTGPNGNSITLPAAGYRGFNGSVYYEGSRGHYWSYTSYGSDGAWRLDCNSTGVSVNWGDRCNGRSIRLVQNK